MTHKPHYSNVLILQNVYSKMLEIVADVLSLLQGKLCGRLPKISSALIVVIACWVTIHVTCILGNYK